MSRTFTGEISGRSPGLSVNVIALSIQGSRVKLRLYENLQQFSRDGAGYSVGKWAGRCFT